MVDAFEGNKAETHTMLPVIRAFMAAHQLPDVTMVADAGMISEANRKAIEAEGLSFILGMKLPEVPYIVAAWRRNHPGEDIPDGQIFTQPWPAGATDQRRPLARSSTTSTRLTVRGAPCAGSTSRSPRPRRPSPGRSRSSATGSSASPARTSPSTEPSKPGHGPWPGFEGYITNLPDPTPEFVLDSYHRLYNIEKSLRMSKSDLAARPIYHTNTSRSRPT
ncbi:hypothetical protein CcI6DRAFT_04220 [Frankia sp. CcI6]|nr:hypothetical protein CcI6DRAFT_04220 [Frankia sp. CcI6]KFB02610.1 hypothetical protein ALLO2DRAFT_04634 [Frankia sp. Allo2]OAA18409.1 transposase family protein [Frankia casuarinae]